MSDKFNCVLIGHESVLIRCGQILLERGHEIRGVISAGTLASEWAASQRLPVIRPNGDIKAFLREQPFDYLFSLANPTILSKEILELPRKYAINCHNSLLPKYAGVHATAWSILHQEKTHGITWHVMTERVDAGDVLRQIVVDIDHGETAFTLDGKCYEAAITSFSQVIDDLERDKVAFKKQNQDERTYFTASTKPSAGCTLSWDRPAHELDAFARALNFGTHPNPLGLPKLTIGGNYLIVFQIDVLDEPSTALPGTIVDIEPNGLKVATTSTNSVLRQLHTLEGQGLSISEMVDRYDLHVGYRFQDIDSDTATRLNTLEAQLVRHEAFWVERLADLRPLALPYPSRLASRHKPRVDCLPWHAPEGGLAFLDGRPSSSWTYGHFLLATFVAFLSRISQSDCFDLGFKPAGLQATLTGVEALFASTVPLRIQVRDEHTLEDVLRAVTEQMTLLKRHLTYPRDVALRYAELRASAWVMTHGFPAGIEFVDTLNTFHPDACGDNELTLVIPEDTDASLWVYDAEKFAPDTMISMQEQFSTFVQRIVADPDQAITTIPLLSDQDLHTTLVAWNDTQADYPHDTCIHHMFEAQVERTPNATALSFDDRELTYDALNRRANGLAHHIQELGVGPDVLVGMCVERSIDMIIGLLGVLKAGGAYVPLDPASPPARLKFMLEDSGAQVLLTQSSLLERLPEHHAGVVCLDADPDEVRRKSQENPMGSASAQNLCYVIYTSGSTGTPKGVLIEHRAVCNLASVLIPLFDVASDSRVLQFASFSFDTSVAEIFMALCSGARLCLARWSALLPGPELFQLLREQAITHVALPPSTLAVLPTEPLPALRSLIVAGEACSADLVAKWAPGRRFFNGYGPTETTVCATVGECTAQAGNPAIGRPIANTQAYILDRHLHPVPVGVVGELHVGGVNVARGYHRRPELTAAKFIANPFSQEPQARLYKTGDLARYLPDGTIEFVGRSDHQVKIRGFRIELEEVESVLKLHPGVEQVVVNVHENTFGAKSLVAYIVPAGDRQPVTGELRRFLLDRLAEYMIPDRFIMLKTMPQTPSGKLDRRALPAPDQQRPGYETYAPPHSDVERFLTSLWADILGREGVSIHDNFFDQGGNSLLSLQAAERISQELGVTIPVVTLYQYPTIHALAQYLAQHQAVPRSPQADKGRSVRGLSAGGLPSPSTGEGQGEGAARAAPPASPPSPTRGEGAQRPTTRGGADPLPTPVPPLQGVAGDKTRQPAHQNRGYRSNDIAIIGMAGRFPGAANIEELWQKLCDGVECISFFTDDELSPLIEPAIKQDKNYVRAKGIVEGADSFDAAFFGITPKEAEIMDPQHRLFLEVAHEALENAGHSPEQFDGSIGVFGGSGFMSYLVNNVNRCPAVSGQVSGLVKALSNDKDYMTTRVAYKLNLNGPCLNIGTACSTSLVAVVNAVNSLLNRQCDMAIAGGVTIDTPLKSGYVYEEEGMHSPDGHCRPFDAKAQGTVMSNGAAVVVLRRLEDALQDGDHIEAVIRGVGINNDGSHKVSFSAPSVGGQAAAVAMAHADAGIDPETISYVEAHGTATPLGDPIEIAALTQAFRVHTSARGFCAIGSVKGNVGHLDTAAGVTGLIKVALAMKHRQIPPSLHFETPNPQIDFANSPFYVNAALSEWKAPAGPRRAGVSSFGMGGTNAHVVCEEAPDLAPSGPSRPRQLLMLSAKTESALEAATTHLAQYLRRYPGADLADVCHTLTRGRTAFAYRRFVVCHDQTDAVSALESLPPQRTATRYVPPRTPEIVFMFPGQGSQYLNMGLNLYHQEDVFKDNVDLCAELMAPDLGCDLRGILFASDAHTAASLHHTGFTQPAMFTLEYALARLWQSWAIHPRAMIGHSIGEFVAACLAGVFSLEDALRLVVRRGQLMEALPKGGMLSVRLSAAEVQKRLGSDLSIAAMNAPALCVVSGPPQAVERLQHELENEGVPCRLLHTSHAFHSAMVEPIVEPFTQHCTQVHLSPPRIDIISTVTGGWMTPEQATDPAYWGDICGHLFGLRRAYRQCGKSPTGCYWRSARGLPRRSSPANR